MPTLRPFLHRHRFAFAALAISLGVHAALIVGVPGQLAKAPEVEAARYAVELWPLPDPAAAGKPAAPPAPRPRPRSPPRPNEVIASMPPLFPGAGSAADALPALEEAPAPLALPEEPAPADPPRPEKLAAALPATPVAALERKDFPIDALPASISIRYSLTSAFADGTAEYWWKREGDSYAIHGSAEAVGFFTLFLEGRILQDSTGKVTAEGLRPERFVERKPHGPDEGLNFDWSNRTIEFRRKDELKSGSLADNTVDWLSMIFQLAHRPPRGDKVALQVYTQRKLYAFELKVLGEETLELPLGHVRALHLRHESADPKETVDVWLGVDHHHLPVKLRYPVARNRFFVEQVATSIASQ